VEAFQGFLLSFLRPSLEKDYSSYSDWCLRIMLHHHYYMAYNSNTPSITISRGILSHFFRGSLSRVFAFVFQTHWKTTILSTLIGVCASCFTTIQFQHLIIRGCFRLRIQPRRLHHEATCDQFIYITNFRHLTPMHPPRGQISSYKYKQRA
jgi:hypothetical protein